MSVGRWDEWTGQEVKSRMIMAMRTLERLPDRAKHKRLVANWPDSTFAHDAKALLLDSRYEENIVRHELGDDELNARYSNRVHRRTPPHPIEIAKMEEALRWPVDYLDQEDCRIMNRWADEVSKTGRSQQIAGELGLGKSGLNKRIIRIASVIAVRLRADKVLPR